MNGDAIGSTFFMGTAVGFGDSVTATADSVFRVVDEAAGINDPADYRLLLGPSPNGDPGKGTMVAQDFGGGAANTHTTWQIDQGLAVFWGPRPYLRGKRYFLGSVGATGIIEVEDPTTVRVFLAETASGGPSPLITIYIENSPPETRTIGAKAYLRLTRDPNTNHITVTGPYPESGYSADDQALVADALLKKAATGLP